MHPDETDRPVNVFVLGTTPRQAVVFSHRAGVWRLDPGLVARTAAEDRREGVGLSRTVDRATAEQAAATFGQTLPSEQELQALMTEA